MHALTICLPPSCWILGGGIKNSNNKIEPITRRSPSVDSAAKTVDNCHLSIDAVWNEYSAHGVAYISSVVPAPLHRPR